MKHKEAQNELREVCRLYGPPGMWDLVVKEQAAARVRQKEALEAQAKARDKIVLGYIFNNRCDIILRWYRCNDLGS